MSNLLPTREQKGVRKLYIKRFFGVVFFALSLLLLVSSVLLMPPLFLLNETHAVLSQRKAELLAKETATIEKELQESVKEVNTRLGLFVDERPTSPLIASVIDPILEVQSEAITISSITFAQDSTQLDMASIDVTGKAETRDGLIAFTDALREVPQFENITVPVTSFIRDENVTFVVTFKAKLQ